MATLSEIVEYTNKYLRIRKVEDWPNALNGLQIENSGNVTKIGAAVDVSTRVLTAAARRQINLLVVHHGLLWPGLQPVGGALRGQLKLAFENDIALYSAHLSLDVHPEVGNNAQLAAALGFKKTKPFLEEQEELVGLKTKNTLPRAALIRKLRTALRRPIKTFNFGPTEANRDGIVPSAAGVAGVAVMRSRLLDVIREQVFAGLLGPGKGLDALLLRFRVPHLLRDLFAEGALSTA